MKKLTLLIALILSIGFAKAQNSILNDSIRNLAAHYFEHPVMGAPSVRATTQRSDTIDLLHLNISLNIIDFANQVISGNGEVQFRSKMSNVSRLFIDLLKMDIDSIKQENQVRPFLYAADSNILVIDLVNTLQKGDSTAVTIFYHGHPQCDVPTFGGLYFIRGYAYNIGVGPPYSPHSVGRAWHPCFDNYVERATYDYHITCSDTNTAVCNGALLDTVHHNDGTTTWHWRIDQPIPSYLAGISVGRYALVHETIQGMNGTVPVQLATPVADTTLAKNSFIHLPDAFAIFEAHYGPYHWNKVGYVMVPYSNVAMEHATNTAYPVDLLTGTTAYENTYAHELAHHWFGDQITIKTAEDYWLKEGWAVFSEKLFYENVYGHARYLLESEAEHESVLHYTHIFDGSYLPEYPVPQQYTYGQTVYYRGGQVARTLRAYMGDTLFFHCLTNYMHDSAFTAQNSYSFRDYLMGCSGLDLTDFFNDWVFSGGFPHFSVDSFDVSRENANLYDVTVHIRQRLDHAPHYYKNVPLEVTFMDSLMQSSTEKVMINGSCTKYETKLSFKPVFVCTDLAQKISDAITENYDTISTTGLFNFVNGKMKVTVSSITGTAFLRIEHNFIAPDPVKHPTKPNLHLSQERYWRVDGVLPANFDAKAVITYDGAAPSPAAMSGGYLDAKLITAQEDSLVLMYRPSVSADWQIEPDMVLNTVGSKTDKYGLITINHLKKGEYTLGIYQASKIDTPLVSPPADSCELVLGVKEVLHKNDNLLVYPNPSSHTFTVEGMINSDSRLDVFDLTGRSVFQCPLSKGLIKKQINSDSWASGVYLLRITDNKLQSSTSTKLIIQASE